MDADVAAGPLLEVLDEFEQVTVERLVRLPLLL